MDSTGSRARAEARRRVVTLRKTTLADAQGDVSPVVGVEAISLVTRLSRISFGTNDPSNAAEPLNRRSIVFVPRT